MFWFTRVVYICDGGEGCMLLKVGSKSGSDSLMTKSEVILKAKFAVLEGSSSTLIILRVNV